MSGLGDGQLRRLRPRRFIDTNEQVLPTALLPGSADRSRQQISITIPNLCPQSVFLPVLVLSGASVEADLGAAGGGEGLGVKKCITEL